MFVQARALLREWGPVYPGTSAGNFNVVRAAEVPGWLVTCHHPDIITFVADYDLPGLPAAVGRRRRFGDGPDGSQ